METTVPQPAAGGAETLDVALNDTFRSRYEIGEQIGRGGMGVVHRGRHRRLDMPVAIKVMLPDAATDRFLREAQCLAKVRSPYVVAVHDFEVLADGSPVLVMEWVDGTDMQKLIRSANGPLPEEQVLPWMRDTCEGMLAVNGQGIVHRDLKPSNLLIDAQGRARVADFGLARAAASFGDLSQSGAIMGTPHYMAPEQAEDPKGVDGRADIYSFGAMFYHALTGRPPFEGETMFSVLYKHKTEPLPSPRSVNPAVSGRTGEVLERCLAKSPHDRFQSFSEIQRHLLPSPALQSPWSALEDHDLAPFLDRYRAGRQGYLRSSTAHEAELDSYEFPRGQVLRICRGDITGQAVDAVVSSDNHHLSMAVGVSAAIAKAAGAGVATQASRLAPVRPGRAVVTSAGMLPARLIIHAVTVGYVAGQVVCPSRDLISEIMASCFYLADSHGVRSVAFPLLGTGAMGFPQDVCLDTMVLFLAREFLRGLSTVEEARVMLFDPPGTGGVSVRLRP